MDEVSKKAVEFVRNFINYTSEEEIKDHFNVKHNRMEQSEGVRKLIQEAHQVFPVQVADGKKETDKLEADQVKEAIDAAHNVIDMQKIFAAKVQQNGGAVEMLRKFVEGKNPIEVARELLDAIDGKKKFDGPTKD